MTARKRWSFWLLAAMTACFCAFVLSLPIFPTEDGPIHLYFANVLGDLLSHHSPLDGQYYYVHHLLPPYSLHYYLLILLMKVVCAPVAEKLIICLIVANLAFGFRHLATSVGEAGEIVSLLIVALLFNWPLGMGFENFSLSLGMACWALGSWTRSENPLNRHVARHRLSFVLLLALMTLTHPVPVVMTMSFAAFDFSLRFLAEKLRGTAARRTKRPAGLLTLIAGASTLVYISFYTDRKRSIAEARQPHVPVAEFLHYGKLFGLAFCGGNSAGATIYRGILYIVLILGLFSELQLQASNGIVESGHRR